MTDRHLNILLVDDQPAKLLTYKAILADLGENLLTAGNAREALEVLLKNEIAIVLVDVYMPDTDGFELAAMIREHPRFQNTAIIFISAVLLNDIDRLRGYEMGAVDYVSVPIIPEVLRAKVSVFLDLFRKTRELEELNGLLEGRVAARTSALASSERKLREAEQLRSLALAAGHMGSWEWDAETGTVSWDKGQAQIFGRTFEEPVPAEELRALLHPDDLEQVLDLLQYVTAEASTFQHEFRAVRPGGEIRWCVGAAAASFDDEGRLVRVSGVTVDITDRKRSEERQKLLAEEVDHRARNVVAVVQSILRITRADTIKEYISAVDGRIGALSTAHKLLAGSRWQGADLRGLVMEEFAPYLAGEAERVRIEGPDLLLAPAMAQTLALALHELVTNAVKHGALSCETGQIRLRWQAREGRIDLEWIESGGPRVEVPKRRGYGTRVFKAGIEQQLRGTVDFRWEPAGLECRLSMPLVEASRHDAAASHAENPAAAQNGASGPDPAPNAGNCVLLVEDEPTVSIMLADILSEQGYAIDGPYHRLEDAMDAARVGQLRGGVLDVNVGGEKVYPLAALLAKRQIPFVFVTGYSTESIDPRFAGVPVLQKPIEPAALAAALGGQL